MEKPVVIRHIEMIFDKVSSYGAAAERERTREAVEGLANESMRHASILWVEGYNTALRRVLKLLKDGDGE